jgi:EAL domain-containing protein (putative c-di-GMP-specific phosphodiesterase class I)
VFDGVISINIGSNELLDPEFENDIISIINKYNVNTSQIELEILEDDLIKDLEIAIVKINSLKKLGINLSIDDFGTGYSSITYLKKLPVNCLKIDRHFTQNLHESSNKELIKMMINMAKTFNMRIVIEGVESESQLKFIKENGADQYQGFYCSKAIDQKSFIQLLKK